MQTEFEKQLESAWPSELWKDHRVLVGVSGGADSVALLRALHANCPIHPSRIVAAHFNHGWRGAESDEDAAFVEQLCANLNIKSIRGSAEPGSDRTEAVARQQRYEFLESTAEQIGARYVATAHTADDQAETVLHRIIRGTGISGLGGIPRIRNLSPAVTIIRPMLEFRRCDVEAYLESIGQAFRHDSSNEDVTYTRNRIRNELLPQLNAGFNSDTTGALLRLSDLSVEYQQLVDGIVGAIFDDAIHNKSEHEVIVKSPALNGQPPLIIREFFVAIWKDRGWPRREMGRREWKSLADVLRSNSKAIVLPGKIECRKAGSKVTLTRLP